MKTPTSSAWSGRYAIEEQRRGFAFHTTATEAPRGMVFEHVETITLAPLGCCDSSARIPRSVAVAHGRVRDSNARDGIRTSVTPRCSVTAFESHGRSLSLTNVLAEQNARDGIRTTRRRSGHAASLHSAVPGCDFSDSNPTSDFHGSHVRSSRKMRGMGFEPMNPYGSGS